MSAVGGCPTDSVAPPRAAACKAPATRQAAASPQAPAGDMTTRSWYMPKASARQLAALVDDVHFATRLPKHLLMGALVNVINRHRAEVKATGFFQQCDRGLTTRRADGRWIVNYPAQLLSNGRLKNFATLGQVAWPSVAGPGGRWMAPGTWVSAGRWG